MTDAPAVRPIGPDDVDALQVLLEAGTEYAQQVTGYPTGPADALSTLLQVPEGRSAADKHVLGLRRAGRLLGVVDVVVGHPDATTATIGLLLVDPEVRRRGHGRELHGAAARLARAGGCDRLRVGVVDTAAGDAVPFLRRLGYEEGGDAVPHRYDRLTSTTRHWRAVLDPS